MTVKLAGLASDSTIDRFLSPSLPAPLSGSYCDPISARIYRNALFVVPQSPSIPSSALRIIPFGASPTTKPVERVDLARLAQDASCILDISCLLPKATDTEGSPSLHTGPVQALHRIADALRSRAVRPLKVGLAASHPDIFEFIRARHTISPGKVELIVFAERSFQAMVEADELLPLEFYDGTSRRPITFAQQLRRWRYACNEKIDGPDLVPCQNGTLFSLSAGVLVGGTQDGILGVRARRIVEEISTTARRWGNPAISWRS
jgi:hypothetical protein